MKKEIFIVYMLFVVSLFVALWWTRYQVITTTEDKSPIILNRFTGKVLVLSNIGWVDIGSIRAVNEVKEGNKENESSNKTGERWVFEDEGSPTE